MPPELLATTARGIHGWTFRIRCHRSRSGLHPMTWFFVDDRLHSHPKAIAAGPAALGLWVIAGSWSRANLTDGFVPDYVLPRLAEGAEELARKLVAVGLWRRARGGYRFHDWSDYQQSREDVLRKREQWRAKKAAQRARNREGEREPQIKRKMSPGDTSVDSPETSGGKLARPSPSPSPSPSIDTSLSSSPSVPDARARPDDDKINQAIIALLAELTGRTVTSEWAARVRRQILDGRDVDRPIAYVTRAISERPRDFLPPDGPAEKCPIHQLDQPCRGCRADQLAGGDP